MFDKHNSIILGKIIKRLELLKLLIIQQLSDKINIVFCMLFLFNLLIHFGNLSKLNTLVFDEWYHAKFAWNYINEIPFFDIHPPLGKLLIALGIKLNEFNIFSPDIITVDTFTDRNGYNPDFSVNTWGSRWVTAMFGCLLPMAMATIPYSFTKSKVLSLIVYGMGSIEGLALAESRLSLLNIFLVVFGFMAVSCFVRYSNPQFKERRWLLIAGSLNLGGVISIKFNGLGFLATVIAFYCFLFLLQKLDYYKEWRIPNYKDIGFYCFVIPFSFYILMWMIHFEFNRGDLINVHKQILDGQQQLAKLWRETPDKENPYCSRWWSWFWLQRPVAYYFANNNGYITSIYAISNPILHYLSSMMIMVYPIFLYMDSWSLLKVRFTLYFSKHEFLLIWLCLMGWAINYLPWMKVARCLYLYHYTASYLFSTMLVSYLLYRFMLSKQIVLKFLGSLLLSIVLMGFFYWLPIFIGQPIPDSQFQKLFLFNSWR